MNKKSATTVDEPQKETVFVPALGRSIEAVDQADIEKQVKKALEAEEGDGNN